MEETLSFLNKKLEGRYQLYIDRRELNVYVFEKGEKKRKDAMPLDDMAQELKHYPNEGSLVMRCKVKGDYCVERRQLINKKKDYIQRFNFQVEEGEASAVKKALEHMILLVQDKKYKSSEPFE